MTSIITGSGHYIPTHIEKNESFLDTTFYDTNRTAIDKSAGEIISKFQEITGIAERRYVAKDQTTSDIAALAGEEAILDAGIDREQIDQLIVAHNFGDVLPGQQNADIMPSLASRVKSKLGIVNPECVAYDVIFGCPGWVQGVIQAYSFIKSGMSDTCLIIGADTLSRKIDPSDRDSMIFADGAGAIILTRSEDSDSGIIACASMSHTGPEVDYLKLGEANDLRHSRGPVHIKMRGRRIYEYALTHVPQAIDDLLRKAEIDIKDVSKILIHQANEKMDHAIVSRLYEMHGIEVDVESVMPSTISKLGNSSVATIPTMYSLIDKGELDGYGFSKGDILVFASVGAGMNINGFVYRY